MPDAPSPRPDRPVCCVADLCVDILVGGDVVPRFGQFEQLVDTFDVEPGGSGAIFASQFARLGGSAAVRGALGSDSLGDTALAPLLESGVDVSGVRRLDDTRTGVGLHLVKPDGDRGTLTYLGSIGRTGAEDLPASPEPDAGHWHVASYFLLTPLRPLWPDWLGRCRAAGVTTSMDTNWDPDDRWEGVLDLLPLIDVLLPNDSEARAIGRCHDTDAAGRALSKEGPLVVVKQGSDGATAYRAGDVVGRYRRPADCPPLVVADAVGAGDSFDAGFLRAWLLGRPVTDCLTLAARCAEATLSAPGGFRGQLRELAP